MECRDESLSSRWPADGLEREIPTEAATESTASEIAERVELGSMALSLVRPLNVEALLDEDAFAEDEFLPYWAELWPSGLALARHVGGLDLTDRTVLELGCGLGLPSLAAARRGAEVTATDWAEDALALLRRNAARNGVSLRVVPLRWDTPAALSGATFDLVLAADVLYEERNTGPLLELLDATVTPTGEAIVADPGRRHAAGFLDEAARSWQVETRAETSLRNGALYVLRRANSQAVDDRT